MYFEDIIKIGDIQNRVLFLLIQLNIQAFCIPMLRFY